MTPRPALRLLHPLSEAAQQLADRDARLLRLEAEAKQHKEMIDQIMAAQHLSGEMHHLSRPLPGASSRSSVAVSSGGANGTLAATSANAASGAGSAHDAPAVRPHTHEAPLSLSLESGGAGGSACALAAAASAASRS